jgi:hypothetical protein
VGVPVAQSAVFCVMFCRSLFVFLSFFVLAIVVFVLRSTTSDYHFRIFTLFVLFCIVFVNHCLSFCHLSFLVIVVSVHLRFTTFDDHSDVFKLFLRSFSYKCFSLDILIVCMRSRRIISTSSVKVSRHLYTWPDQQCCQFVIAVMYFLSHLVRHPR